mgnify:CR=1 FL=1
MGNSKMNARERIDYLFDDHSFVEVGGYVSARNTDYNLGAKKVEGDGVITGYGVINDRMVYVYSQDASALGGSVGEMHAKKIASLYDLARRRNDPYYVSIGASGAVSAVLFTSIFLDPWGKILFFAVLPIPGIIFGVIYLAYCQYMAKKAGDNINHNAHFYGALYGLIYPAILEPSLIKRLYLLLFS